MRRIAAGLVALALVLAAVPAGANVPRSFTACGSVTRHGDCGRVVNVIYGKTVYLRGKVKPPHADLRAGVWHKGPFDDAWERWATVGISERGVMRYAWRTTLEDGAQDVPHYVQFRIKGHGKSNRVRVYVWLGE